MNATQKKTLAAIVTRLTGCSTDLSLLQTEVQEEYDNLSERAQEGEKGQELEGEVTTLEEAVSSVDEVISTLE